MYKKNLLKSYYKIRQLQKKTRLGFIDKNDKENYNENKKKETAIESLSDKKSNSSHNSSK